jgi:hypothetical protein
MKAKEINGIVVEYLGLLPKKYNINGMSHNLNSLPEHIHEEQGFYRVFIPEITIYQNLISLIPSDLKEDVDIGGTIYPLAWVKRVYDFTPAEILAKDEEIAENAMEATINKRVSDGIEGVRRLRVYLERKYVEVPLNDAQRDGIEEALVPVENAIIKGEWKKAKKYFTVGGTVGGEVVYIDPPGNSDLLDIYNFIKNKIDQYITNNY